MHTEHNIDDFRTPFNSDFKTDVKFDRATAAQIDALTTCLTSIHTCLDCILSMESEVVVNLPTHRYGHELIEELVPESQDRKDWSDRRGISITELFY